MNSSRVSMALAGAAMAAATVPGSTAAHHSDPNCKWFPHRLPDNELIGISVERNHFMQGGCDGTVVKVRAGGGHDLVLRSRTQGAPAERDRGADDGQPAKAKRGKASCKRKKGNRKRCRQD